MISVLPTHRENCTFKTIHCTTIFSILELITKVLNLYAHNNLLKNENTMRIQKWGP